MSRIWTIIAVYIALLVTGIFLIGSVLVLNMTGIVMYGIGLIFLGAMLKLLIDIWG